MSIFSSLDYILTKTIFGNHETATIEPPQDILRESNSTDTFSQFSGSANSSTSSSGDINYLQLVLSFSKYSIETEINKSYVNPIATNWTDLNSFPISTPNTYLEKEDKAGESFAQYPNETYPDAEYLLESWWNIFDTRYLKHGWGWTITLIIAYMLILVVGVIGNLIVILVVLKRRQMRTVTNMFIMNLAVADLFVILFCVPSTLLTNIFSPWILGSFMCKAVAYVQGVSGCASAYSLAAISLDRCQAIYRNCERPRGFSQTTCIRTVMLIWVTAMSLTVPWAVIFEIKISEYDGLQYCVETWQDEKLGKIYFLVVNLSCFYASPLLLIFVSNWIIYCHVTHRNVPEDSVASAPIRKMHRETRHHVLKMLGIVTLTFLFCWLPIYFLVIIIKFTENISESGYNLLGIVMPIAQWLGSSNSSINPILYAFLNKKFRRMFRSILPSWFPFKTADIKVHSQNTPTFIANQSKKFKLIGPDGKMDNHLNNRQSGFPNQTNLLISRFNQLSEKVMTSKLKTSSSITSTSQVSSYLSQGTISDMAIAHPAATKLITDL